MSKNVSFSPHAKMLKGFNTAADAVSGTLGPKGRNVWIDDAVSPKFTNDGFSIAASIVLKDPEEESGNKILKNTCGQTVDDAGDGTTTSAVLVQAIVRECMKRPENPVEVEASLRETLPKVVAMIKRNAKSIPIEDIKKVALISAENEELAESISDIIRKLGKDATITVEDSYDSTMSYDLVTGYEANVGFVDPRFADPKDSKARAIFNDASVYVTDKKISAVGDIQPILNKLIQNGENSCVIVCDDIDNSMVGLLLANKMMGKYNSLVIRATGDLLKDIEACVGATRTSDLTGVSAQNVDLKHLGKVKKVICDANKTIFIAKDPSKSTAYANHLRKFVDNEPNMYIKQKLERRIAQLKGGVAILKIGSQDFQREYLKDKADDAIKACKAALLEGVVEGGGLTLWKIAKRLPEKTIGETIMKQALNAPLRKILENANKDYTTVVINMEMNDTGYDARNDKYVDMLEAGIIDPAKVTRVVLENAVSNAAKFITMFASVTEDVSTSLPK